MLELYSYYQKNNRITFMIPLYYFYKQSGGTTMKKLLNFKTIKMRILFSFAIVLVLFLGYGYYSLTVIKNVQDGMNVMVSKDLKLQIANQRVASNFSVQIAAARGYILSDDPKYKDIFEEYNKLRMENEHIINQISDKKIAKDLVDKTGSWYTYIQDEVFAVYEKGDVKTAAKNLTSVDEAGTEIRKGFEELADLRSDAMAKNGEELYKIAKKGEVYTFILAVIIILLTIVISMLSARVISQPIITITARLKKIASGDLTEKTVSVTRRDEIGQLGYASNDLTEKLQHTIASMQDVAQNVAGHSDSLAQSADEIKQGSNQISITMQELAEGTEEQASHAGELSSSTDAFVQVIRTASDKGNEIYNHSTQVLDFTSNGAELMEKSTDQMKTIDQIMNHAVENMQELNRESEQISMLVKVINGVADQTNLLALNAAIEAARAGEAGKGFAVVADEVRKLAEQVSSSVTDISNIVEKIQANTTLVSTSLEHGYGEVVRGTEQIQTTSETFETIHKAVTSMATGVKSISNDLQDIEQSSRTIQVAVDEISSVSEESAAGVEETTATIQQTTSSMEQISSNADELATMAQQLNQVVRQFKL